MSVSLPLPTLADGQGTSTGRFGLMQVALPAPSGWERGGFEVPLLGCTEPEIVDRCMTFGTDRSEMGRPSVASYSPVQLEADSTCSTLSELEHDQFAQNALAATTEFALGRELLERPAGGDALSLSDLETVNATPESSVVAAVSLAESEAVARGLGRRFFLHAPVHLVAHLRARHLIDSNGRSPFGAQWVLSSGYVWEEPVIWVTGAVWAGAGAPVVQQAVTHRRNDAFGLAWRSIIAGFDPCPGFQVSIDPTAL